VQARLQGVLDEMATRGLAPVRVLLGEAHDFDACRDLAWQVLTGVQVPSAVIGTTDVAAVAAIHAAIGLGLSVPGQLSVIGFDDLPMARTVLPALTTVAQPLRQIGTLAVDRLCALMAGDAVAPMPPLALTLVPRQSTGPAR
jgi:LacI family transcriptional regulator